METCVTLRVHIPVDGIDAAVAQRTLLLVSSDADLRAAAGRALEAVGYRVIAAAHSGHALLAGMTHAHIDIVVTELVMEEMSGPSLAERLRRHHPDLQAVYFAHSGTPQTEGILVRPFTRDTLLAQVEAAAHARA